MRGNSASIICFFLLAGCASAVVKEATSDRYTLICGDALNKGQLDVAEDACNRALASVEGGNIAPGLRSERLYNLALVKRGLKKYREAEELLKESLRIEQNLPQPSTSRMGKRQVELALNLAAEGKWDEGARVLDQFVITPDLQYEERTSAAEVLNRYAKELRKRSQGDEALLLEKKAADLVKVAR